MVEDQITEIKSKIDIVDFIQSYLPLKKKGRNFWANCPFHGEKTPSFSVSPELQIFKCFGCGKSGDILTFLQEYEKIDFAEALQILADRAGVKLVSFQSNPAESQAKKIIAINSHTANFYHYILTKHPLGQPALKYLASRGITPATIKLFKIGFSPPDPKHLLTHLLSKGFNQADIASTGTFGQSGNYFYDRFKNRLVFPLIDHRDRIVAFSGRILPSDPNQNMAKYINSPETTVYHKGQMFYGLNWSKDYIRQADNAFIVEGEFDLISPFQAGFKNIVALKGTAFTESQLTLLKRYCQNITLMLDSDFAGLNATRKSILLADSLGFNINAVDLGSAKDPDLAVRSDPTLFKKQVKQAVSIWDFIITASSRTYDASTDIGKKNILSFTFPFLTQIDNQVIKSSYLSKLASLLDVDPQSIFAEASRFASAPSTTQSTNIHLPTSSTDSVMLLTQKLQLSLLIHLFSQDQPRHFLKEVASYLDVISLPSYQKIINILQAFRLKTFSPSKFIHKLPPELVELFEQIYIQSQDLSLDHIQTTKKVISLSHQIKTIDLKQQQKQLSLQIAQAEKLHQLKQAKKLQIKYNHILNQIGKIQSKI